MGPRRFTQGRVSILASGAKRIGTSSRIQAEPRIHSRFSAPREVVHQFDGLGHLPGDGEGQAAGHQVQVAAVEHGEGHGLQGDERHQDDQQRPAQQGAGEQSVSARPRRGFAAACQTPGFST